MISNTKIQHYYYFNESILLYQQFDLVCGDSWVTATIISVQMFGMMAGSIIVGHLGKSIALYPCYVKLKRFKTALAAVCI